MEKVSLIRLNHLNMRVFFKSLSGIWNCRLFCISLQCEVRNYTSGYEYSDS